MPLCTLLKNIWLLRARKTAVRGWIRPAGLQFDICPLDESAHKAVAVKALQTDLLFLFNRDGLLWSVCLCLLLFLLSALQSVVADGWSNCDWFCWRCLSLERHGSFPLSPYACPQWMIGTKLTRLMQSTIRCCHMFADDERWLKTQQLDAIILTLKTFLMTFFFISSGVWW